MPLPNELLDLVAERVALFGGVADRPVVLAVLAPIGIRGGGFFLAAGSESALKASCRILAEGRPREYTS